MLSIEQDTKYIWTTIFRSNLTANPHFKVSEKKAKYTASQSNPDQDEHKLYQNIIYN